MEYYDRSGSALAELKWSSASTSKQFVLQTQLYPEAVAAPTFSPDGGTFSSAQTVTITTTTSSAVIRYTRDGREPTPTDPSIASGGTVSVGATTTLKARAWKDGYISSEVSSATFTIGSEIDRTPPTASITNLRHNFSYRTLGSVT